jgi:ketosteroid isomerase-like protein
VEVYAENATLLVPPDGDVVTGRDEIRAALEPQFALRPTAKIDVIAKLQAGDLALTNAHWRLAGTDADGNVVELAGSGTIVSRRQPDGTWLIVLDRPVRPD